MLDLTMTPPKVRTHCGAKHDWELVLGTGVHAQVMSNAKTLFSAAFDKIRRRAHNNVSFVGCGLAWHAGPTINEFCGRNRRAPGLGLKAEINLHAPLNRKNYFLSPDLPQGLSQRISQLYHPIVGRRRVLVENGAGSQGENPTRAPGACGNASTWNRTRANRFTICANIVLLWTEPYRCTR